MAYTTIWSWLNADGLPVNFGLDEARLAVVTEYTTDGGERVIDIMIPNAAAFDATNEYFLSDKVTIPEGAIITNAKTKADSTDFASSGGGTISIGTTIDLLATSDALTDIDSIVALASVAEMNAGGSGNSGTGIASPGDGTLVMNNPLAKTVYLTLSVDTAVFQAGVGGFEISYIIPKVEGDTLVYSKA